VTEEKYPATQVPSGVPPHHQVVTNDRHIQNHPAQQPISTEPITDASSLSKRAPVTHSTETARQRIEQELQRQRMMALSGNRAKTGDTGTTPPPKVPSEVVRQKRQVIPSSYPIQPVLKPPAPAQDIPQAIEKKTVIIRKRTPAPAAPEPIPTDSMDKSPTTVEDTKASEFLSPGHFQVSDPEEKTVTVKDSSFRAKDDIFSGKNIRGTAIPKVREASLIHTNLKPKKPAEPKDQDDEKSERADQKNESSRGRDQGKKMKKQDDISWI